MATPNLGITKPVIHTTLDPEWSQDINAGTDLIDAHDHSPGKGAPIHSNAIDIDANLSMQGYDLTNLNQLTFNRAATVPTGVYSFYWYSNELWLQNGGGVPLQLTQNSGTKLLVENIDVSTTSMASTITAGLSPYTIDANDAYTYYKCDSPTPITINLPYASSVSSGRFYIFKDISGNAPSAPISIIAAGTNKIDRVNTATTIEYPYGWIILTSDGATNWYILKSGLVLRDSTLADGFTLMYNATSNEWVPSLYPVPDGSDTQKGIVQFGGDLAGSTTSQQVDYIRGIISPEVDAFGHIPGVDSTHAVVIASDGQHALEYVQINNLHIDPAAAIDGSKISPDFAAQDIVTTGSITAKNANIYGLSLTPISATTDTNITSQTNTLVTLDSTSAAFYVKLPNPATNANRTIIIKDIAGKLSTNQVTIKPYSSENINGMSYDKIISADYGTWILWTDGTNWYV